MSAWLLLDLTLAAAVLVIRCFLWMPVKVDGRSMRTALQGGEWLWASRISLKTRGLKRGDIVLCHYPGRTWKHCRFIKMLFVKRVVGLPGETISIVDGVTHINGEPLEEPYLDPACCRFRRTMPERAIGPDEVFLMGDNRNASHDCRAIGPLKLSMVRARVTCVLWPLKRFKRLH